VIGRSLAHWFAGSLAINIADHAAAYKSDSSHHKDRPLRLTEARGGLTAAAGKSLFGGYRRTDSRFRQQREEGAQPKKQEPRGWNLRALIGVTESPRSDYKPDFPTAL
jgi:hypothetical protein